MAKPVIERVLINEPRSTDPQLNRWASFFGRQIVQALQDHGTRLNLAITDDGDTPMKAPLILATFTVATLPSAADFEGGAIYVSDGAGGTKFRGSDGTAWVDLG